MALTITIETVFVAFTWQTFRSRRILSEPARNTLRRIIGCRTNSLQEFVSMRTRTLTAGGQTLFDNKHCVINLSSCPVCDDHFSYNEHIARSRVEKQELGIVRFLHLLKILRSGGVCLDSRPKLVRDRV